MQKFNYHCHTSFKGIFDGRNTIDEMISGAEAKELTTVWVSVIILSATRRLHHCRRLL